MRVWAANKARRFGLADGQTVVGWKDRQLGGRTGWRKEELTISIALSWFAFARSVASSTLTDDWSTCLGLLYDGFRETKRREKAQIRLLMSYRFLEFTLSRRKPPPCPNEKQQYCVSEIRDHMIMRLKTRHCTRQHQSRTGGQGHWWKLDHFSAWFCTLWRTNRPTDQPTDRQSDL